MDTNTWLGLLSVITAVTSIGGTVGLFILKQMWSEIDSVKSDVDSIKRNYVAIREIDQLRFTVGQLSTKIEASNKQVNEIHTMVKVLSAEMKKPK